MSTSKAQPVQELGIYLKEHQIEETIEIAVQRTLRTRAPHAEIHMAGELLTSSADCSVHALGMALTDLGSDRVPAQDKIGWLLSRIGLARCHVTIENLLDIFDIVRDRRAVWRIAMETLAESRTSAVCAAAAGTESPTEEQLRNAAENLKMLDEISDSAKRAMQIVLEHEGKWSIDESGRIDTAPHISGRSRSLSITQVEVGHIRRVLFAHAPPTLLNYDRLRSIRERMFAPPMHPAQPTAVVSVGAPGSGKTYVLRNGCLPILEERYRVPGLCEFVHVDPDIMISELCDNNNAYRPIANFCNHETFLCAVAQRRHMIFDGTGKDLNNTCGRVISRLTEAGYRVFICIVVAQYKVCLERIATRKSQTGRDVPEQFVRSTYEAMKLSVPLYLQTQAQLAEAVLVFNNDADVDQSPQIVEKGSNHVAALQLVNAKLTLPAA